MSRMHEINELEIALFGRTNSLGVNYTFDHIDNYLTENYFGKNSHKWHVDKMIEEAAEVRDVFNQLHNEFKTGCIQDTTIDHLIEEVGDFILASASCKKLNPNFFEDCFETLESVQHCIDKANDILIGISENVINPESVFKSNKAKLEEFYFSVKAYEELLDNNPLTDNIFVKLMRRLYTINEIRTMDKHKIIKELRRMRFAVIHHQQF